MQAFNKHVQITLHAHRKYSVATTAYDLGLILRIIGYKFGENNARIIGCI